VTPKDRDGTPSRPRTIWHSGGPVCQSFDELGFLETGFYRPGNLLAGISDFKSSSARKPYARRPHRVKFRLTTSLGRGFSAGGRTRAINLSIFLRPPSQVGHLYQMTYT